MSGDVAQYIEVEYEADDDQNSDNECTSERESDQEFIDDEFNRQTF